MSLGSSLGKGQLRDERKTIPRSEESQRIPQCGPRSVSGKPAHGTLAKSSSQRTRLWTEARRWASRTDKTYCVAPIASGDSDNYDFWAVGINCCPGSTATLFTCGEYTNPEAHSGLKLMRGGMTGPSTGLPCSRPEAAYHIKANHPLFFVWMKEPETELQAYLADAFRYLTLGGCGVLGLQSFCHGGGWPWCSGESRGLELSR